MKTPAPTASRLGLWQCPVCHLLSRAPPPPVAGNSRCPRCGAPVYRRKPDSLHRAWALVLAAYILYIPANLLPVSIVTSLGKAEADTILSGVEALVVLGMWPVAALLFFASIVVPVLKLVILTYLLISVQCRSRWRPRDRTVLYRLTEAVGRWSMVDIFVITILITLIKIGAIANFEVGSGALAFAAVVVITIFAAMSFDPRLIWDIVDSSTSPTPSKQG
jgi:paraquat-inducible protein A